MEQTIMDFVEGTVRPLFKATFPAAFKAASREFGGSHTLGEDIRRELGQRRTMGPEKAPAK
ncbi:hypothetical protein LO772_32115 [Yinghuangia sp. ASG 101]|uniref:hypothetical protein n=1 Tax=Yinghuangia sp. ASG 101 TaxID=2896848 RepID=UPI001E2C00D6|nr:hypothetical protein [Yinghuangia sp. ASG 101]UGQ11388.1 hypothetical protein LO772_32115 [Yinghuangia sp. ASG 101]